MEDDEEEDSESVDADGEYVPTEELPKWTHIEGRRRSTHSTRRESSKGRASSAQLEFFHGESGTVRRHSTAV